MNEDTVASRADVLLQLSTTVLLSTMHLKEASMALKTIHIHVIEPYTVHVLVYESHVADSKTSKFRVKCRIMSDSVHLCRAFISHEIEAYESRENTYH